MFIRFIFAALLCMLGTSLHAQKIDTLNLRYPSDFYFHPGDSLRIYIESDSTENDLVFKTDDASLFDYQKSTKILSFHFSPKDRLEKLLYVIQGNDTLNIISFFPSTRAEKRSGFSRYNISKILDESSYQKITIDSSNSSKTLKINGRKLTFSNQASNLFYKYIYKKGTGNSTFRRVEIGADTLVINDPIYFPGANLRVSARVLIINYTGELPAIDITPIKNERVLLVAYHKVGNDGDNAGTLEVFYKNLVYNGSSTTLFAANGGNGQNAPHGKNGIDYPLLKSVASKVLIKSAMPGASGCTSIKLEAGFDNKDPRAKDLVWIDFKYNRYGKGGSGLHGTDWETTCDGHGANDNFSLVFNEANTLKAKPLQGGKPGEPGNGGKIISNHDVALFSQVNGGIAGLLDSVRYSGKISGPLIPFKFTRSIKIDRKETLSDVSGFDTLRYPDTITLQPLVTNRSVGSPGSISSSNNTDQWINLDYASLIVDYANDLFKFGHVEEAEFIFNEYANFFLATEAAHPNLAQTVISRELSKTLGDNLSKIRANLDYYGNPYGFVPGLELIANYGVYTAQIHSLTNTYASILYIEKQLKTDLGQYNSAVSNIESYLNSNLSFEADIQDIENVRLPFLEEKIDSTLSYMDKVGKRIIELENKFKKKAKQTLDRKERKEKNKQLLKTVATIAKVVPVGQPALGLAASVFEAVALKEDGVSLLGQVGSVISDYKLIKDSKNQFEKFKSKVDNVLTNSPPDLPIYKTLYNNRDTLSKYMEPFLSSTSNILKKLKLEPVTKESLAAEISKLKARNPEYNKLIDSVQKLTELNKELLDGLLSFQLRIRKLNNDIVNNSRVIDIIKGSFSSTSLLSEDKATTLAAFRKEVFDRLNYYQYLYAKAYEYFTLRQYKGYERTFFLTKGGRFDEYQNYEELIKRIAQIYSLDVEYSAQEAYELLNTDVASIGKSTRLALQLSRSDINKLNQGEPLSLNFFRQKNYNLLIKEMENSEDFLIEKIIARPVYNPTAIESVKSYAFSQSNLTISHKGTATRYKDGTQFDFHHVSTNGTPFYEWSFDRSFINNKTVERETDQSYMSLINMLISKQLGQQRKLVSFDSDFTIQKSDANPDNLPVKLDSLELNFHFVLLPRKNYKSVYLSSSADLGSIPFTLLFGDETFKGAGIIYKSFTKNSMIQISSPKYWMDKEFDYWMVNGKRVTGSHTIDYQINRKLSVITPFYR
ncbi:hypothetical protein OQX61_23045 [Pedobacter sp. PLR]|uniref:hypothetical protein n=1 Tax=Pedobacter sp. PLR TaxID=2994465 RepID=UPI002245A853|nr:hypothetical protein [Pedobacter sp. PLR]MCX2454166.1 hypothetical protein [Pedobacter sp. PLR]